MSLRGRHILGSGAGALLAAGLVTLAASSIYLRAHNQGQKAMVQAPPVAFARALARKAATDLQDPAALRAYVDRLSSNGQGQNIRLAAVIVDEDHPRYRFMRGRTYLAHGDPSREGKPLTPTTPGDKELYDLCSQVRVKGARMDMFAPQDGPFTVRAAEPILVDGKRRATAVVITEPGAPSAPVPAWPLGLGLALCVAAGLAAGLAKPKPRYAIVMAATLAYGVVAHGLLTRLGSGYRSALDTVATKLAAGLGQADDLATARTLLSGITLEDPACWVVSAATVAGLLVGLLGLVGIGRRMVGGLHAHRFAYAYITPAAAGMLLLVFVPFGYGVLLGFFNHSHGTYTFVGLDNFVEILSGGGRPLSHPLNFYFTLGVTILWTASNIILHVTIGLALALLLKDPLLKFKGIYRVLLILPWAVPNYITALIWKGMFHQQYGAVNHLLSMFGIENISWFSSFSTAFIANLTTNVWLGFPFMMVVSLGALQSIPDDVYEAAAVDGASRWQAFWQITMPLLKPALFPAIILGTIWTFNQFNIIYLVSGGAPAGSTDILITEAYRWAFERADRYGLAAAYALLIFFILLIYTLVTNKLTRASEDVS